MKKEYEITPNKNIIQTKEIQDIFDLCKDEGGTIIFHKGTYLLSSIYVYSNTTVVLEEGALLLGSKNVDEYIVFDIPKGMNMRSDMEMIPEYYQNKPWDNYRKAMFTAYQERNITFIGSGIIDGQNCVDINGEEGYRGPHGLFFSNCENIILDGYTIRNSGNFMHQLDVCKNVKVNNVFCLGGSDGFHLHECQKIEILNCKFETGDDCIAGINIQDLHVNNCFFNTSCDVFRIGGNDILIENSEVLGPGKYPHRKTIFVDKDHFLPITEGRHNTICLMIYFASKAHPAKRDSDNIVFRNMKVKNSDMFLVYNPNCDDLKNLQNGNDLVDVQLDNVIFEGLKYPSNFDNRNHKQLVVTLSNVESNIPLFIDDSQNNLFINNIKTK